LLLALIDKPPEGKQNPIWGFIYFGDNHHPFLTAAAIAAAESSGASKIDNY
jgi:hypothetical protein